MAEIVRKPYIGQIVYKHYESMNPGIVTAIAQNAQVPASELTHMNAFVQSVFSSKTFDYVITVKHLRGQTSHGDCTWYKDFYSLIADHERKALKFRRMVDQLTQQVNP